MPMMRVSDFLASNDSSFMNGLVARRSSSGAASSAPSAWLGGRVRPVGRILAPDLPHRLRHLLLAQLGSRPLRAARSKLASLPLQLVRAFLGRDQLLGLTGETLLRHAQDVVEVGAAFGVGQLELAAGLDLLQPPVEVGVLLACAASSATLLSARAADFVCDRLHLLEALAESPWCVRLDRAVLDGGLELRACHRELGLQALAFVSASATVRSALSNRFARSAISRSAASSRCWAASSAPAHPLGHLGSSRPSARGAVPP